MQTNVAKKIFAIGSAVTLAAMLAPAVTFAAAHADGTNVCDSSGTCYMIISGQRRPYTSAGAFLSYGFNSWSSAVTASADDLALPVGSFIPPQDGKIFCATATKGSDVQGECSLITGGQKAAFTSAGVFTGLGFSFSRAEYGDSSFLTKTANIDTTNAAHNPGVLVNNNGTVQLMGANGLLGIPDLATFNSWGYSFADVVPANVSDKAMTQTGVMAARVAGQLSPTALTNPGCTTNCGNVVSGPVSVSLSSDTPAATTLVTSATAGQVAADLAHFVLSGNGTVTSLTFQRTGVSDDSTLANVYLYDGATRLTDAASVSNGGLINFSNGNGLFTVSGSRIIAVKSDIAADVSGQTVGVKFVSGLSGTTAVTGYGSGNLMNVSLVTNLTAASFATPSGNGTSPTTDPANDIVAWQSTLTVSNHDANLTRFAVREIGSLNYADISNFRLLVDGTQVAQTPNLDVNGYATFAVNPVKLLTSGTHTVKVLVNLTGGSSRTFSLSLRNKADIGLVDTTFGVEVGITSTVPATGATYTVSGSSSTNNNVSVQKTVDSPSGNVISNGSDVVLGRWSVTVYGEAVKVDVLNFKATVSSAETSAGTTTVTSLRNGRVLIGTSASNLSQYGSTATFTVADKGYTVNYTFPVGTPTIVELRGDIYAAASSAGPGGTGALTAGTVLAYMDTGTTGNGQGQVSSNTITVPASAVQANSLSVVTGTITLAAQSNYANQTTTVPQTAYKLGAYNLTGSTNEDVNIDTIIVDFVSSSTTTFSYASLHNVYVMYNGVREPNTKSTVSGTASANSWSVSHVLAKNSVVPIEVYGDIDSTPTAGNMTTHMGVSGTTVSSGVSASDLDNTGQAITAGTGTLSTSVDGSSPVTVNIAGNQTKTAAAFKFAANSDTYTVTEVTVSLAHASQVNSVVLRAADGADIAGAGVKTATMPGDTSITFSGLSWVIPANANKVLDVDLVLGAIGTGGGTSGQSVRVSMTGYKANNSGGTQKTQVNDGITWGTRAAADIYVFKAIPTITNLSLPTSVLAAGSNTLAKISVSSGGTGTVAWSQLIFSVTKSANPTMATASNFTLYDADSGTAVTNVTCVGNDALSVASATSTKAVTCTSTTDQEVSGAKNYQLKVTVGGTPATNDYISTNIATVAGSAAGAGAKSSSVSASSSFIWSDENLVGHLIGSSGTADYFNDFLVKNLATDSQTLTK